MNDYAREDEELAEDLADLYEGEPDYMKAQHVDGAQDDLEDTDDST